MDSTNVTIIIAAADQQAAQADLGADFFITPASATGQEPATNYFTSGWFLNTELDRIADEAQWKKKIRSADWQVALAGEGLQMIVPPIAIQN